MRFRPTDRDDGLRRVSRLTRWLAAGGVALLGIFSGLVASALPGTSGTASGSSQPTTPTTPNTSPSTSVTPQTSPAAPSDPSVTDPNLAPAPPPVVSHHQSVASSGGS
ncbi:MAG TPA: hypothetical protein VI462_09620 [Acidimicrobiia bacterium]|jgi:hypothetical protein